MGRSWNDKLHHERMGQDGPRFEAAERPFPEQVGASGSEAAISCLEADCIHTIYIYNIYIHVYIYIYMIIYVYIYMCLCMFMYNYICIGISYIIMYISFSCMSQAFHLKTCYGAVLSGEIVPFVLRSSNATAMQISTGEISKVASG